MATALSSRPIVPPEPRADLREPRPFERRLLAASGVSGLIYVLYVAFVAFLPYRLAMPGIDIFDVLGGNARGRALYCGAILALFAAAVAVWDAVARSDESPRLAYWVVVPPVLFAILLTVTQPLNSRDLFHYILEGRILGSHASNPFLLPPAAFPNDPLYVYSNWHTYPAPYGPLWVLPAAGLTLLAGDSLFWSVVLFKLLALAAYLACGALLWGLLRRAGRPPLPGLVLWLWNPLVLIELVANGHNDVLMLAAILGGLWLALAGRLRAAFLALTAAALVKYTALPLLPLLLWHVLRPLPGWRARGRVAVRLLWAPGLLVVGALAPFWIGPGTLGFLRESDHYYASVPHVVRIVLEWFIDPALAGDLVRGSIVVALLVGYAYLLREAGGERDRFLAALYHTMLLMIVLWTFFVPWYVAWAVPLAALVGTRRAGRESFLLSTTAMLSYVGQFYKPARGAVSVEFRSALSAILVFAPFLTYVAWKGGRRLQRRRRRAGNLAGGARAELDAPALSPNDARAR